jgi:type I restriction enzyme, R subunit
VVLVERLREAIRRLNPLVPHAAREDALHQVLHLEAAGLLALNRHCHRLLVNGVSVQYQLEGETRGDFLLSTHKLLAGAANHVLGEKNALPIMRLP